MELTLSQILDDLRAADEIVRRLERRYWLSSADFYDLYQQGLLDDGDRTDDYALWAGFHLINLDRQAALSALSRERVRQLRSPAALVDSREPVLHADDEERERAAAEVLQPGTNAGALLGQVADAAGGARQLGRATPQLATTAAGGTVDFKAGRIQSYAYTIWYGNDRLGWFDPAPPGPDPALSDTYPHHYHDLTGGVEQLWPANGLSFVQPNLPGLLDYCLALDTPPTGDAEPAPEDPGAPATAA